MVNGPGDQQNNNDFFNYYFNTHGASAAAANNQANNNNPQPNSNIQQQQQQQQQQQSYLDDNSATIHDLQHVSSTIQAMQQNMPQQIHNPRFLFMDPTTDHQQQSHQISAHNMTAGVGNSAKVDPNSFIQSQYTGVVVGNNSTTGQTMFDTSRANSRDSQLRIGPPYIDQPTQYMANVGGQQPTSPTNIITNSCPQTSHQMMQNYTGYMIPYPSTQPVQVGQMPGVYSKASPATVLWLLENYESSEGVSLPRCLLYAHYIYHCKQNDSNPVNSASFGKLIRSLFPNLKTRRLGTRGKSKYHYYGIRIRDNSVLHSFGRSEDEVIDFLTIENEPFLRKILPQHPSLLKTLSQSCSDLSVNSDLSLTAHSTMCNPARSIDSSVIHSPPNSSKVSVSTGLEAGPQRANLLDDDSVISISLRQDFDHTPQDLNNSTNTSGADPNSSNQMADTCYFTVEQFYRYFPDQSKHASFALINTQDYPTLKSFDIELELLSDAEYEKFMLFPTDNAQPGSSLKTNPVCRLKHFLKYLASKLLKLIPQLDTTLFLNQIEDNFRRLSALLDCDKLAKDESRAIQAFFQCDDVIDLNKDLDIIVYQFLVHRLFPKIFTYYPSQYICCVRSFARKLEQIVVQNSSDLPKQLKLSKIENVRAFGGIIRHYTCLSHIFTGAVNCIQQDKQSKLSAEITKLDLGELIQQNDMVFQVCPNKNLYTESVKELVQLLSNSMEDSPATKLSSQTAESADLLSNNDLEIPSRTVLKASTDELNKANTATTTVLSKFKQIKSQRVKDILSWARSVKDEYFKQLYSQGTEKPSNGEVYCKLFQKFTSIWNYTMVLVVREMTLQGSSVFGLIHIFHLLFFEFIPHMLQHDLFELFGILPIHYYILMESHNRK